MNQSEQLFNNAKQSILGGVNSPVRSFKGVGGTPVFIQKAKGAYIYDHDNKAYIDYVASWGPMILGHAHPKVVDAVKTAANSGLSFGAPTEIESQIAEKIKQLYPSIDLLRMVSSGTEATMSAIRLARGFTSRDKIIKFAGCYHGHADSLLVDAGSGALTLSIPGSSGVPDAVAKNTVVLEYNNADQAIKVFSEIGDQIAGVIVEPIAGNMNCVIPDANFLQTLRRLCNQYESVLIFDEVMTGFRVALGGAQQHFGIQADLTTLGKIVGGGMPVGVFGGKSEIMQTLAPLGEVYQAGTLSGNPIAMAAGLKTLELITVDGFYESLCEKTTRLLNGIKAKAKAHQIPLITNQIGSMFGLFFTDQTAVRNFDQVKRCNNQRFNIFFHTMLKNGVYFAPSAFEAGFVSCMHGEQEINFTIDMADLVFAKLS